VTRHATPGKGRVTAAILALLASALLAACTGTFEEGAPLVLLVATGSAPDGSDSSITAFLVEPPTAATPRSISPLSPTNLAGPELRYPVQGWDWVDRQASLAGAGRGRTQLVVLAGTTAPVATDRVAELVRYDVAAFTTDTPSLSDLNETLSLVRDGVWDSVAVPSVDGFAPLDGVCLVDVSVSSTGRYAALLDVRSACGETTGSYLHIVDTLTPALIWSSTPSDVATARPFIDQGSDRVDVWTTVAGGAQWQRFDLASGTLLEPPLATLADGALRDVSEAGADRWALSDGRLRVVAADGTLGGDHATVSGADRRFVPTAAGLPVVIIGGGSLVVHPTPTSERLERQRAYRAGATDVADRLTYLVRTGAIDTLDLLVLDPARGLDDALRTGYTDAGTEARLSAPRALTWFRPRLPPTP